LVLELNHAQARKQPIAAPMYRRTVLQSAVGIGAALLAGPVDSRKEGTPAEGTPGKNPSINPDRLSFAFIGDIPYNTLEERDLLQMFAQFKKEVAFAIHVGDIKSGVESCDDASLRQRLNVLAQCPVPLVLLPGDNEWVDCGRTAAGQFDALERLQFWRDARRPAQAQNDRAMGIRRQAQWPENTAWDLPNFRCGFVTLNVPGTFDGGTTKTLLAARRLREVANMQWLRNATQAAQRAGHQQLFIAIHANPRFGDAPPSGAFQQPSPPFKNFLRNLRDCLTQFDGQVTVLYGDSHRHHIDFPWSGRYGPRLRTVECYGSPFSSSWLKFELLAGQSLPNIVSRSISS
jgi:hypothetical protein